ncbi:MAG: efflux transporter outer membrane subunit [Desulfomonilia bacterium]|jgi:multidrug efflux system outer membrane protein
MRNTYLLFLLFIFIVLVSGCAVGPDYHRPSIDTPAPWRYEELQAKTMANTAWWEQFDDPVLNDLILVALKENKDILIAAARIEEFMGRYRVTRSEAFPQVGGAASGSRTRVSDNINEYLPSIYDNPYSDYLVTGNASWEIDLWGKIRRANEAARANLLSTEEDRRTVIMSLVCAVADAYIDLRDLDRELEIAEGTLKSRENTLQLFRMRFNKGVISELELRQVQLEYEMALATVPVIQKLIIQQENLISVLLGRNPGAIARGKAIDQFVLPTVPSGLPSDLLAQRPDIRQAEQDLISANAEIGVAKAAYFPSISLTGSYGVESKDLSNLFKGPAHMWSLGVPINMPIFTAGAISGQVKAAEAIQKQSLIRYQQVIQQAFKEVNNALVDQSKTREQLQAQKQQEDTARAYVRLARLKYENGYVSYLEVLDAERSMFNVQLSYVRTQADLFRALVNLYKSMGGGWVVKAEGLTKE